MKRLARRYACSLIDRPGAGLAVFHDKGEGSPPRKRCRYCRGEFNVQEGLWGVFVWRGDGHYPMADAVETSSSLRGAERLAVDALVVRWIPKDVVLAAAPEAG